MKRFYACFALIAVIGFHLQAGYAKEQMASSSVSKRILIVYFSHTGNTREIANQIKTQTGGDIFEIQTVQIYPGEHNALIRQAKKEQESGYRPLLRTNVKNFDSYNVVILGYPNWWGTMPMAVYTFLEMHDFSGKKIVPFCTHEGSGMGSSERDIKKLCPGSTVAAGLAIVGGNAERSDKELTDWLKRLGLIG